MNNVIMLNKQSLELKLHDNVMNILFNHKREIAGALRNIKGIHNIDHVAIIIINPNREVGIFSLTPSVEYNLIINDLWKFDRSFNPTFMENGSLRWWDDAYHPSYLTKLRQTKENMHHFTLGMNLARKVDDFTLIYSFATRSDSNGLKDYYLSLKDDLFQIGDYGYKLIRDISSQYCAPFTAPYLPCNETLKKRKSHLKLIINNK